MNLFWENFAEEKDMLEMLMDEGKNLLAQQKVAYLTFCSKLDVCIFISAGTRNGVKLPEYADKLTLNITPGGVRQNCEETDALYKSRPFIGDRWVVTKYKCWSPAMFGTSEVETKTATYTHKDFEYFPIVDKKNMSISIMLFIDSKELVSEKKITINEVDRTVLVPVDNSIYAILENTIGEFAMLNILNKMEIHFKSDLPDYPRFPLEDFSQTVQMISNMKNHKCGRCGMPGERVELKGCPCKKIYYCNKICQKGDRAIHKDICF